MFIEKYIIKVDGKTYTISENSYGEIKSDNGNGGIWEWLDRQVGSLEYEVIKAVANGNNVKIRFSGKDYYKDKIITEQQKTALNKLDITPKFQGLFCMDDRECSFRRHIEFLEPNAKTFGTAAFFNFEFFIFYFVVLLLCLRGSTLALC